jgi:integrase
MTIRARGQGWCFDFRYQGGRYTRSGFPSETIARDAEAVTRARLVDQRLAREYGIRPPRGRIPTLRGFLEKDYLPSVQGRLSPSTFARVKAHLSRLVGSLGMYRVTDITARHLEEYRNERSKTLQANSLRAEFAVIRQFFRAIVVAGHLQASPARAVGLPREERGPDRILTEEEQARLLGAFYVQVMADMTAFNLWCGLRPGELCGLRGRHVDLKGARLSLPQPKVERPKIVPLLPEAMAILLRQPAFGPDDPVFRGPFKGSAIRQNVYRRAFHRAVEGAGIPPIRPQDLRHTVAVRLIRAGADLATVGDILGHKPPYRTTARYIAHTSEDRKREVLERLRQPDSQRKV